MITQCKGEVSFKESTIEKLISSFPFLLNLDKDEDSLLEMCNPSLVEKVIILRELWKYASAISGSTIELELNYCCKAAKVDQLEKIIGKNISQAKIKFVNLGSKELLKLHQEPQNSRHTLLFEDNPLALSYGKDGYGFVGTVKLGVYKKFLTDKNGKIDERLFESNIRHFQGDVDVNKGIRKTIQNSKDNGDFWWFNNGVTIIAEDHTPCVKELHVDNAQIVNGLQTSYSIFEHHDGNIEDNRSVLVKVVINNDRAIVDNIIASTNRQNPVSAANLRATDKIQRKIEMFFHQNGFFYDRRKSFYKNQGKPIAKIFSIQFVAQAIEAIGHSNPSVARARPNSLLKSDSTYQRIFDEETNFKSYLNCCLIARKTYNYSLNDKKLYETISNFKFHLSRIAATLLTTKEKYTSEDLAVLDIENYTQDVFDRSVEILNTRLSVYREQSTKKGSNIINISKAKGFTDELLSWLKKNY